MKINEFIKKIQKEKELCENTTEALYRLINPVNDLEHDLTAEEMGAIDEFTDRYCQGLADLTRQAFTTSSRILRQKMSYKDTSVALNEACDVIWHETFE